MLRIAEKFNEKRLESYLGALSWAVSFVDWRFPLYSYAERYPLYTGVQITAGDAIHRQFNLWFSRGGKVEVNTFNDNAFNADLT